MKKKTVTLVITEALQKCIEADQVFRESDILHRAFQFPGELLLVPTGCFDIIGNPPHHDSSVAKYFRTGHPEHDIMQEALEELTGLRTTLSLSSTGNAIGITCEIFTVHASGPAFTLSAHVDETGVVRIGSRG